MSTLAISQEPEALDSQPRKRKSSSKDDVEGRVVKHRSSKACRSCRTRKVRCDVSAKGSRCTNCELDGLECIVLPSRRGQSNRVRRSDQLHHPQNEGNGIVTYTSGYSTHAQPDSPSVESRETENVPAVVTFDDDADTQGQQPSATGSSWDNGGPAAYEMLLASETRERPSTQEQQSLEEPLLPPFVAPVSTSILPEDLDFLLGKGAFVLPDSDLRIEVLRAYLFSVHPFMPMLDVGHFVRAVQTGDKQVSLLLFQAVMFAGLHSLQPDVVQRLGFRSPKQAREVFFNRVRLLYDFNVEDDNAAVLQSLILMSSWYSKRTPWNERRHTWHWTGLAYDLARSMGLHREPAEDRLSPETRRFRRRLWWSLYIRDRLIALGTRRPMRIHDEEFDVEILTLEDFDLEPTEYHSQVSVVVPSKDEATSTALMCIELTRLCVCIGRVVSSQYTTLGNHSGASHSMMVMPRRDGDHSTELEKCESELQAWIDGLSSNVPRSESAMRDGPRSCSAVHWSQLNMTYLTVVNVLHRAQALRSQMDGVHITPPSRSKVKNAARSITKLGQEMLQHDQVRFLGLIGVTAFLAASLTHMLDAGSTDEDVRDASTFRLYQSLQVLQALREVYASADSAFSFLASVTRKAGINLLIQPDSPTITFTSSPSTMAKLNPQDSMRTASSDSFGAKHRHFESKLENERGSAKNHRSILDQPATSYPQQSPRLAQSGHEGLVGDLLQPLPGFSHQSHFRVAQAAPLPGQGAPNAITSGAGHTPSGAEFGVSSSSAFAGSVFDWNGGIDTSVDFGSMPFTYDFFSDAFGFLEGDLQGL